MKACYVHVPFCKDICSYCDFTRCRYHKGLSDKWLLSLKEEVINKLQSTALQTLYIGGGTPSALEVEQFNFLLETLSPYTSQLYEYTVEANVDSLSYEKIMLLNKFGVDRISLGVQTLQSDLLKKIHRMHTREEVLRCIQMIHEVGIHNISIDLIYALPSQTMSQWQQDLQDIVDHFNIHHISLYALTIEEHSVFGREGVKGAGASLEADMFEYAITFLEGHGFEHYEISNFAKKGMRSKHNQMYWHYEDFVGIGCGASGKEQQQRYDNTKNLQVYFEEGPSPDYIVLSKEDEMFEMIMMGLRMKDGVSLARFKEMFQEDLCEKYKKAITKQIKKKMLEVEQGYLKTTYQGMLLLNDVLLDFMD